MRFRRLFSLSESDRRLLEIIQLFIDGRLADQRIFEWALNLNERQLVERLAVKIEVDDRVKNIHSPWIDAWRILIESWDSGELPYNNSVDEIDVRYRLSAGDRSGDVIRRIVDLVRPVLAAKPRTSDLFSTNKRKRKTPKAIGDLLSIDITSSHPVDPIELGIGGIAEIPFLVEIAEELDSVISKTLSVAKRIGCDSSEWRIGVPKRVYYVPSSQLSGDEHEPDEFATGIAGVTKLLCAVVRRIAEIDASSARSFVARWRVADDMLRKRLWCVMARDEVHATPTQVFDSLIACNQRQFWSLDSAPEVAEVRAVRFADMSTNQQLSLVAALKKGPPISFWGKGGDKAKIEQARQYRALRELKRIEIGGGTIPKKYARWYQKEIEKFPELKAMKDLDEDFWSFKRARWVPPNPDRKFDEVSGSERLSLLEVSLSEDRHSWDNDPSERALDWIRDGNNARALIADFESSENIGASFPKTWQQFGWSHRPIGQDEAAKLKEETDAEKVLRLIFVLPVEACAAAIEGLSSWLDSWDAVVKKSHLFMPLWMKLWPIAAASTNADASDEFDPLNTNVRGGDDQDPGDLDTLNTAAGRLVGSFLQACPTFRDEENPFAADADLRAMRDACLSVGGRSELIARYRFIQELMDYLLAADREWAKRMLLDPLLDDTRESLILWRALAWHRRFSNVLRIIGHAMIERVSDERLGRDARSTIAVSVVLEILHAFNMQRDPEVQVNDVTQMLRSASDDVRVEVAKLLEQFVSNMSAPKEDEALRKSAEELFRDSIRPFLERVWPQESGLSTPAVARGFSDLPASCKDEFTEAVQAIYRFLVPFESWSLFDYGMKDRNNADSLEVVDNPQSARALLDLLDATISGADGVAFPMELGTALEKISSIAPTLAHRPAFRRLATLARR